MSRNGIIKFGEFLIAVGLFFLLYEYVNWGVIKSNIKAVYIMGSGILLIIAYIISVKAKPLAVQEFAHLLSIVSAVIVINIIIVSLVCPLSIIGGDIVEERTDIFEGDLGDFKDVSFDVEIANGDIKLKSWNETNYRIVVVTTSRAWSEEEVEEMLNSTSIKLDKEERGSEIDLDLMVDLHSTGWFGISTDIEAYFPENMSYDLELETANGLIELEGINGSSASLENVNGDISVEAVNFSDIYAETVNGRIQADLTSNDAELETVNGKIDLEVGNTGGKYKITTVNGDIIVKLHLFNDVGYHVEASTSVGNVDIDIPDFLFEMRERKHQEAWTEDFELMEKKIHIIAETANGDIEMRR
jgi:DUF4097 and DUF4098 domain-containing protein YvlB